MRARENGLERGPQRLPWGAPSRENLARRFQSSLRIRGRRHAMAGDELEQAEYQCGIACQLSRITEQQAFPRDREFLVGEPGPVFAEVVQERALGLLGPLHAAPRLVENGARAAEILTHPVRGSLSAGEYLRS